MIGTHAQSKTVVFENDLDDDFVRILGILCKCPGAHAQRSVYFRGVLNLKNVLTNVIKVFGMVMTFVLLN